MEKHDKSNSFPQLDKPALLIKACIRGDEEKCKILLEEGVPVNQRDEKHRTPLIIASKCAQFASKCASKCTKYFNENSSNNMKRISKYINIVKMLLDHGASIDLQDNMGYTALMWASWHNSVDIVKILLEHGADVDLREEDGWSALMMASQNNHLEVVLLLIGVNANPHFENEIDMSPFGRKKQTALARSTCKTNEILTRYAADWIAK